MPTRSSEGLRFLVVGAVNTGLSFLLYWLFLRFFDYRIAYTISYVIGIVISYLLNSRFVFRTPLSLRKALAFPLVYLMQYGLGVGVLWMWVSIIHLRQETGVIAVVALTLPATFLLSRFLLKPQQNHAS